MGAFLKMHGNVALIDEDMGGGVDEVAEDVLEFGGGVAVADSFPEEPIEAVAIMVSCRSQLTMMATAEDSASMWNKRQDGKLSQLLESGMPIPWLLSYSGSESAEILEHVGNYMHIPPLLALSAWIPIGVFLFRRFRLPVAILTNFLAGWAVLPSADYKTMQGAPRS